MTRIFQLILCFLFLLATSPIVIIALILVLLESKENPFFWQKRFGKNKRVFHLYKIKTMCTIKNINDQGIALISSRRLLRIGKILRKFKIDEFPQMFNILKGDMNIIGFRPEIPKYLSYYSESELISIKPGLISPASLILKDENNILKTVPEDISLYKAYLNLVDFKIKFDSHFLKKGNLYLSLILFINTVFVIIFSSRRIYLPQGGIKLYHYKIPKNWYQFNQFIKDHILS